MAYKIILDKPDFPLEEGDPFASFDAGEEFLFQMEKYFPSVFSFHEISKREGNFPRKEVLFEGNFILPETSNNKFYVFVLQTECGGRPNYSTSEYRLQFRKGSDWIPKLSSLNLISSFSHVQDRENREVYVICIHKFGKDNHNVVFTGIYPQELELAEQDSYTSPKSFQFSIESIRDAYLRGLSIYHKNSRGVIPLNAIHFKPNHLLWYMENRDKLHLQDIETAGKLIKEVQTEPKWRTFEEAVSSIGHFFSAIRTKPFLLLAGISGTGKSRIVREFAFKSCPKYLQDKEGTTPGNYCMIEVKPNWHDSTELLGYYSNLSGSYQFKKFVKFLVKAKMFPDVPFFVCLDEMNLAPVEQYFAEILSILETRKHPMKADGGVDMNTISTGVIVEGKYFRELSTMSSAINQQTGEAFDQKLTDRDIYLKLFNIDSETDINEAVGSRTDLTTIGLTLPDNVIIIGTVNMDDTTHQFSRKVIDRAMTIEMNGGKLVDMFGGSKDLEYIEDEEEQKKWQYSFSQRYVTADEVLDAHPEQAEEIKRILPERLESINMALKGTPFEVSYRVLNELTIMVGVMIDEKKSQVGTIDDTILEDIINQAVNNIMLMKILPRIEGDAEMFALSKAYKDKLGITYNDRLEWLKALAPDIVHAEETQDESGEDNAGAENGSEENPEDKHAHYQTAKDKIQEMIERLNNQDFTRFWP